MIWNDFMILPGESEKYAHYLQICTTKTVKLIWKTTAPLPRWEIGLLTRSRFQKEIMHPRIREKSEKLSLSLSKKMELKYYKLAAYLFLHNFPKNAYIFLNHPVHSGKRWCIILEHSNHVLLFRVFMFWKTYLSEWSTQRIRSLNVRMYIVLS